MMSRPPVKLAQDNRVTVRTTIILENVIRGIEIQFLGKSLACDVTFSWCNGRLLSMKLTPATSNPGLPAGDDTSVDTTSQPSTQANTLICLIGFYHTGNLQVNRHNCEHMFHEMDQLRVKRNIEAYYSHLESLVDVNNCLHIQNALQNWDFHFKNKVNDYIFNKFEDVTSSREFLSIGFEQLKDLLRSKKPSDFSEDGMFNSIMCWVNHKPEQRNKHELKLLEQLVNVQQLSLGSLQKYVKIAQHENRILTDYLHLVIEKKQPQNNAMKAIPRTRTGNDVHKKHVKKKEKKVGMIKSDFEHSDCPIDAPSDILNAPTSSLSKKPYFYDAVNRVSDVHALSSHYHQPISDCSIPGPHQHLMFVTSNTAEPILIPGIKFDRPLTSTPSSHLTFTTSNAPRPVSRPYLIVDNTVTPDPSSKPYPIVEKPLTSSASSHSPLPASDTAFTSIKLRNPSSQPSFRSARDRTGPRFTDFDLEL